MERTSHLRTRASLVTLVIFVFFPVRSWCEEDIYSAPAEAKSESYISGDTVTELKRLDDIDDDSFVSLMGRRSAAQPKKQMDHILTALLRQRTRMACPCTKEYSQTKRGQLNNYKRQRFRRFL